MKISQLNDHQTWDLAIKSDVGNYPALSIDSTLAKDLCLQHINGMAKIIKSLPSSQEITKIKALLDELNAEIANIFGGKLLEKNSNCELAVKDYIDHLGVLPDGPPGITHKLKMLSQHIANNHHVGEQELQAHFIASTNMTPYQMYRKKHRG